jgi:hypothetical protein
MAQFPIHLVDVETCPKCGGAVKIMPKALAALAGQALAVAKNRVCLAYL